MTRKALDKLLALNIVYLSETIGDYKNLYCRKDKWLVYISKDGWMDISNVGTANGKSYHRITNHTKALNYLSVEKIMEIGY